MADIQVNLERVKAQIAESARLARRDPGEIQIVAVTKNVSLPRVLEARAAGVTCCGENRVQEFLPKHAALGDSVRWHFIGRLQTNKVKQLLGKVELIHSLDRLSLAQEIQRQAAVLGLAVDVLVQVNLAGEETKSGLREEEVLPFLRAVSGMDNLRVRGLMTIAPLVDDPEEVRPVFRGLRLLADRIRDLDLPGVEMWYLSMGMSNDFGVAVEEGANLVRVGTLIFGARWAG